MTDVDQQVDASEFEALIDSFSPQQIGVNATPLALPAAPSKSTGINPSRQVNIRSLTTDKTNAGGIDSVYIDRGGRSLTTQDIETRKDGLNRHRKLTLAHGMNYPKFKDDGDINVTADMLNDGSACISADDVGVTITNLFNMTFECNILYDLSYIWMPYDPLLTKLAFDTIINAMLDTKIYFEFKILKQKPDLLFFLLLDREEAVIRIHAYPLLKCGYSYMNLYHNTEYGFYYESNTTTPFKMTMQPSTTEMHRIMYSPGKENKHDYIFALGYTFDDVYDFEHNNYTVVITSFDGVKSYEDVIRKYYDKTLILFSDPVIIRNGKITTMYPKEKQYKIVSNEHDVTATFDNKVPFDFYPNDAHILLLDPDDNSNCTLNQNVYIPRGIV